MFLHGWIDRLSQKEVKMPMPHMESRSIYVDHRRSIAVGLCNYIQTFFASLFKGLCPVIIDQDVLPKGTDL